MDEGMFVPRPFGLSSAKAGSLLKLKRRRVQVLDDVTSYAKWERVFTSRKQTLMQKACDLEISTGSEITLTIHTKYGDAWCYASSDDLYSKLLDAHVILQSCVRVNNELLYKNYHRQAGISHQRLEVGAATDNAIQQDHEVIQPMDITSSCHVLSKTTSTKEVLLSERSESVTGNAAITFNTPSAAPIISNHKTRTSDSLPQGKSKVSDNCSSPISDNRKTVRHKECDSSKRKNVVMAKRKTLPVVVQQVPDKSLTPVSSMESRTISRNRKNDKLPSNANSIAKCTVASTSPAQSLPGPKKAGKNALPASINSTNARHTSSYIKKRDILARKPPLSSHLIFDDSEEEVDICHEPANRKNRPKKCSGKVTLRNQISSGGNSDTTSCSSTSSSSASSSSDTEESDEKSFTHSERVNGACIQTVKEPGEIPRYNSPRPAGDRKVPKTEANSYDFFLSHLTCKENEKSSMAVSSQLNSFNHNGGIAEKSQGSHLHTKTKTEHVEQEKVLPSKTNSPISKSTLKNTEQFSTPNKRAVMACKLKQATGSKNKIDSSKVLVQPLMKQFSISKSQDTHGCYSSSDAAVSKICKNGQLSENSVSSSFKAKPVDKISGKHCRSNNRVAVQKYPSSKQRKFTQRKNKKPPSKLRGSRPCGTSFGGSHDTSTTMTSKNKNNSNKVACNSGLPRKYDNKQQSNIKRKFVNTDVKGSRIRSKKVQGYRSPVIQQPFDLKKHNPDFNLFRCQANVGNNRDALHGRSDVNMDGSKSQVKSHQTVEKHVEKFGKKSLPSTKDISDNVSKDCSLSKATVQHTEQFSTGSISRKRKYSELPKVQNNNICKDRGYRNCQSLLKDSPRRNVVTDTFSGRQQNSTQALYLPVRRNELPRIAQAIYSEHPQSSMAGAIQLDKNRSDLLTQRKPVNADYFHHQPMTDHGVMKSTGRRHGPSEIEVRPLLELQCRPPTCHFGTGGRRFISGIHDLHPTGVPERNMRGGGSIALSSNNNNRQYYSQLNDWKTGGLPWGNRSGK